MWIVVTIAGLAVELTAIVVLGRSVTRRDEDDQGTPVGAAIMDEPRATAVVRGYVDRAGADVPRGPGLVPEPRLGE